MTNTGPGHSAANAATVVVTPGAHFADRKLITAITHLHVSQRGCSLLGSEHDHQRPTRSSGAGLGLHGRLDEDIDSHGAVGIRR